MGDDNIQTSPRRLRNHSYKESLTASTITKMSGKIPELDDLQELSFEDQIIPKDEFAKKSTVQKLDAMADAMNKIYEKMNQVTKSVDDKIEPIHIAVMDEEKGSLAKVNYLLQNVSQSEEMMKSLIEENLQLRDELDVLKGIVHKLSNQLEHTNGKVSQLMAKSMEDNLIFTGILGDAPKANVRKQLHNFFIQEMSLHDVRDVDILSIYRMGIPAKDKNRPIVAHCTPDLRRYIMNNAAILKNRLNAIGAKFFINPQLPESIAEQRREIRQIIKKHKDKEEDLPKSSKSTYTVRNDKLFINGQLKRKKITTPQVQQLFPGDEDQKAISAIKMRFFHTQPEKGSEFKVAVLRTASYNTLNKAYIKLFQKYPTADHIAVASIIGSEEEFNDNGEFGSGFRILRCLKQKKAENTAVFLIRYFGGQHLGPRRFSIMTDLVNAALDKVDLAQEHPRSPPMMTSPVNTPQRFSSSSSGSEEEDVVEEENPQNDKDEDKE